jgi:regulator of chromosome condensation
VLKVACGGMHTIVIAEGGLVYSWGVNDEGALGRKADKNTPDAESKPGLVPMPSGVAPAVDVSTGDSHVAVATSDGAVVAWGTFRTSSGLWAFTPDEQIARSPVVVYTPVDSSGRARALASGTDHVIALTAGGDVYSWGCGEKGRLGRLPEADADNVSKRDDAAKRKLLTPSKVPNLPAGGVTAIAAGSYHSFGIAASPDGSKSDVFGWGLNSYGQLGMPYDFSMPASSQLVYFPKRVDELCGRGVVAADGGEAHTVALAASGKVYAFGRSAYGRLGLAGIDPKDDEPRSAMSEVAGVPGRATAVVAGGSNSGAVTASGDAYLWGYGELGQIGRGDDQSDALTPERVVPTKNMKDTRVAAVSFGGQHAALLCVPADGGDAGGGHAAKRAR